VNPYRLIAFITIRFTSSPYTLIVREVSVSVILAERDIDSFQWIEPTKAARSIPVFSW
jgi:hypothetical protein